MVGDYFYVYFNNFNAGSTSKSISVARALKSNVINEVLNGCAGPCLEWKKYDSTSAVNHGFTNSGLNGNGMNIIPPHPSFPRFNAGGFNDGFNYDIHQDAIYSKASGKYYLSVGVQGNPGDIHGLLLYSSSDGIHWNNPKIIEGPSSDDRQPYATMISPLKSSKEMLECGSFFYLTYPRTPMSPPTFDQVVDRKKSR